MDSASVKRVRMMNNRPTLLLDGADTLPLIYALSDFPGADSRTYQAQKNIAAFHQAGINLVACDTNLLLGWYKASEGDYDALRAELSYVLDANPDARIFLRLHLNPPYWWLRDHPEELIVYRTILPALTTATATGSSAATRTGCCASARPANFGGARRVTGCAGSSNRLKTRRRGARWPRCRWPTA